MKKLKKIISVLLTIGMVCSMSVNAYAYDDDGEEMPEGTAIIPYKVAVGVDEYGNVIYQTKTDVADPYITLRNNGANINCHVNVSTKDVELCKDSGYKIEITADKYATKRNVVCSYCGKQVSTVTYRNGYYYMSGENYKKLFIIWPYTDIIDSFVYNGRYEQQNPDMSRIYDFTGETYQEICDKFDEADATYKNAHVVFDENLNIIKIEKCAESECGCHVEKDEDGNNELVEICNGCKSTRRRDIAKIVSKKAKAVTFKQNKKYTIKTDESSLDDYFYEQIGKSYYTDSGIKSVSAKASKAGALTNFKWNSKTGKATFKLKQKCTVTLTVTTNLGGKAVIKYKFK